MTPFPAILAQTSAESWWSFALGFSLMAGLIVLSGLFSGSETVLFAITPAQLKRDAASQNPLRRLAADLMAHPKRTLTTVLIANTSVNVLLFATSVVVFGALAARHGEWINYLAAVFSVLLVIVLGEVTPKIIGVTMTHQLAPYAAGLIGGVGIVFGPIGRMLDAVVIEPLSRILFGSTAARKTVSSSEDHHLTRAELKALLELSRRHGVINPVEDTWLREVIDLRALRVRDVMTPRVRAVTFDVDGSPDELRRLMRDTKRKKIPVYDDSVDNIIGMIYAKVLFFEPEKSLRELVQPVRFVPEIASCEQLLEHFRSTRSQVAVAVDEFGGMAGIVALEDVVEAVIGDVYNPEDDRDEPEVIRVSETEYDISGQLNVTWWAETFGVKALADRVRTVAGLVAAQLGRAPAAGDAIHFGNVELEVRSCRGWRVDRLTLRLLEDDAPAEGAE
ncbi:MAG: HlyC/CorC family transporter [Phycisphaerales bacterium]|nr:HlyC/CorC family transporter [Phycisphaerales bacterium]